MICVNHPWKKGWGVGRIPSKNVMTGIDLGKLGQKSSCHRVRGVPLRLPGSFSTDEADSIAWHLAGKVVIIQVFRDNP